MAWARIDDSLYDHPKIIRAGNAAVGLWTRGLSYAARYETDGVLSPDAIRRIGGRKRDRDRLVEADLWEATADGGYLIHDYLGYNPTHETLARKRANTAERQRRHRAQDDEEPATLLKRATNAPVPRQSRASYSPVARQFRAKRVDEFGAADASSCPVDEAREPVVTRDRRHVTRLPTRPDPTRPARALHL